MTSSKAIAADTFSEFVKDQLKALEDLEFRPMFGGFGLYLEDRFFAILFKGNLYFKTSPASLKDFLKAGSKAFSYRKKGGKPVKLKHYYEVPPVILEDRKALAIWAHGAANA